MIRAFVALPLPEEVKDRLEALQAELPAGRPAARDTFHLTLAFAGEHPPEAIGALHEELALIRADAPEIALSGLGTFGRGSPKLLFANVAANAPLTQLQQKVKAALRRAGIPPSGEKYHPHVTLARFRHRLDPAEEQRLAEYLAAASGFAPPPFRPAGFNLCQSTLRQGQPPLHEVLADYPLGTGTGPAPSSALPS